MIINYHLYRILFERLHGAMQKRKDIKNSDDDSKDDDNDME